MQLLLIVVGGVVGGLIVALLIGISSSRPREERTQTRLAPPSPYLINMAHIRIAGVGGLGMVAMAFTVTIFVPRIRSSMAIALLLGGALAAALIAYRRRNGPLGSSTTPGAHVMFPMETPPPRSPGSDRAKQSRTRDCCRGYVLRAITRP